MPPPDVNPFDQFDQAAAPTPRQSSANAFDQFDEKPPEQPTDTGIFPSLFTGIAHGAREAVQSAQVLGGAKPEPAAPPKTVGEMPVELSDLIHPYRLAEKVAFQFGAGAGPMGAGAVAGAAAAPYGPLAALGAGSVAYGITSAVQQLGPLYAEELAKDAKDPEAAWSRTMAKAAETGAFGSLGWAAFGVAPFASTVKNLLFQAFVAQPGLSVAERGAQNLAEGRPATEGAGEAYAQGVAGSAIPIAGIEGARYLGRRIAGHTEAQTPPAPEAGAVKPEEVPPTPEAQPPAPEAAKPTGDQLPRAPGSEEITEPAPAPDEPAIVPPPEVPTAPPARPEEAAAKTREELVETAAEPVEKAEDIGDKIEASFPEEGEPAPSPPEPEEITQGHAELVEAALPQTLPAGQQLAGLANVPGELPDVRGDIESANLQGTPDLLIRNAQFLRDIRDAQTLPNEAFGIADPRYRRMLQLVLGLSHDPKIFESIVQAIPVDVMHDLVGPEWTAESLLHNGPVFEHALAANADLPVTRNAVLAAVRGAALPITEHLRANIPEVPFSNGPAVVADDLDQHENIIQTPQATKVTTPQIQLAKRIQERLEFYDQRQAGARQLTPDELQAAAEQAYGAKLAEGKFTRADMYEALELGVNQFIVAHPERFSPIADLAGAQIVVRNLEALKNRLPTQTVRAGERDTMQQFSTPPDYAYTAAWVGEIRPGSDRVLEPSAGTGSLVAMAHNGGAAEIITNELSGRRADLVHALNPDREFRENAEQLHNIMPADVKPTLVLMNPPFSQTAGRMGDKTVALTGARHIDQALARLEPGGRLVAIVGRGMKMFGTGAEDRAREGTGAQFRDWWRGTSQNYDVRANIGIPGSVYGKYGTNFGTQLLVIDKVPPSGRPVLTGEVGSLPEAMEKLDAIRQDRPVIEGTAGEPVAAEPAGEAVARPGEAPVGPEPPVSGATPEPGVRGKPVDTGAGPEVLGGPGPGVGGTPRPEPEPGVRDEVVPEQPERPGAGGTERLPTTPPGTGEELGGGGAEPDGVVLRPEGEPGPVLPAGGEPPRVDPEAPAPESVKVDEVAADPTPGEGAVESVYEPYKPQISIEGAKEHPGNLVESAALASVRAPKVTYQPILPRKLIDTGALSGAQLEGIVSAGQAHSQVLPAIAGETPYRRGFMLGDGTGAAKGRQVAGIMLDNMLQGRQKHLWLSESRVLIEDARRDWMALGGKKDDVFDLGKVKAGNELKASGGIGFLTYDTLKGAERVGKDEQGKTIKGQRRLDQIAKWLGPDFDGVIAFDECVPAGTLIATPEGAVAIERLSVGDVVLGFDHENGIVVPTPVRRTFRRKTHAKLHMIGPVTMTGNHSVWTENSGYVPALWIDQRDVGLYLSQYGQRDTIVRVLRRGVPSENQEAAILREEMLRQGNGQVARSEASLGADERRAAGRAHRAKSRTISPDQRVGKISGQLTGLSLFGAQSVLRSYDFAEGGRSQSTQGFCTPERREWSGATDATAYARGAAGVDNGVRGRCEADARGLSAQLQNRYCQPCRENRGGNRWQRPSWSDGAKQGRQEDSIPGIHRLDRPSVSQSGCPIGHGPNRGGNLGREVFNIETGTANYFANRLLVHNSHNMANAMPTRGTRGVKDAAAKALAGIELQQMLPNSRVVYVSATGATEVNNLAYAERLGLWGRNTPFPSKQEFVNNIGSGGIAAMELVARDMKAMGHYLSRNLSYDDVKYDRVEHTLTPEQKEIYDGLAEGWQNVLRNIEAALLETSADGERPDASQRRNALSAFWSGHQRFFNQVITSMQMPSVIRGVEQDLKEGRQAVLQLVNTNEASQKRAIEKRVAAEGRSGEDLYEDLDLTPRDQLMQMIDKSFPTQQTESYVDENGIEGTRGVVDSQGNPVHNPQAVAMKEALLDRVGGLRVPDGPLEILINHFGPDKVAEVTGRGQRVIRAPDENGMMRATLETRGTSANAAEASAFQNAKKPILVFSQAGGTGRSYHAENGTPSADAQRSHYLVQAGWRADKAIQGFGRTHRTNQASAPIFHLVTTDLQGQRRFISSIARRLSQLGALTKGERRAGDQGLFSAKDNLESPEANAALRDFWIDMQRNNVEGVGRQDWEQQTGLKLFNAKGEPNDPPEIPQFLNRLLSLKYDMQNHVFGEFDRRLGDAVDRAAASGTLDVGTETLRGDRIRKEDERTVYTDPQSGAETKYVRLGVDTKNKPATFEQVASGQRLTAGREPVFWAVSKRTGKIYGVAEASSSTDSNGRVTEQYRLVDPMKWDYTPRARMADERYWERVDDQAKARDLWNKQVAAIPEYSSRPVHLVTGAVLPIWDRLEGTPKVYRLQTSDGERMLGRVIDDRHLNRTMQALGAETSGRTFEPQEIADRVLQGDRATLANGWALKRSVVAGEPRIEIVGPNFTHRSELKQDGAFIERIQYDTRFFIPTGENAADTISRIIARRPVTEMGGTGRGLEEGAGSPLAGGRYRDLREDFAGFRGPSDAHDASWRWTRDRGQETGHEHLTAYDAGTGDVTHAYTMGLSKAVGFMPDLEDRLQNQAANFVVHHNHPGGNSLSGPDIRQLPFYPGLDSILAHGRDDTFAARLTPEMKMKALSDPIGTETEVGDSYDTAEKIVHKRLQQAVDAGRMTVKEADAAHHDLVNRAMDAAGLTDYMSSRVAQLSPFMTRAVVREAAKEIRQDHVTNEDFDARVHRSTVAVRPDEILGGLPRGDGEGQVAGRPGREAGEPEGAARVAAETEGGRGLAEEAPPEYREREEEAPPGVPPRPPGGPPGPPTGPPPGPPPGGRWGTPEERNAARDAVMHTDRTNIFSKISNLIDRVKQGGVTGVLQYWQDDLKNLEREEKQVGGGKLLPKDVSPTAMMRFARNSSMAVETQLRETQLRYNPDTHVLEPISGSKPLTGILGRLRLLGQQAIDDFKLWAIVQRAARLKTEGRERNVPDETIDRYRDLDQAYIRPDGSNPFREVHSELQEYNKNLLNLGEAAGIINRDSRALFEHDDYVPFFRALEQEGDVAGPSTGRAGSRITSPIRYLKGGEAKVNDIFDNLTMNTTAMVRRSMENIARRWTVHQLSGTDSLTPLSKAARAELETPEAEDRLRAMGLDPDTMSAKAKEAAKGLFGALMKRDESVYSMLQDGKPLYYRIDNPQLMRSLVSFGPAPMDALTRILSGPARVLRAAVVFDPAFALAHNLRMSMHAWVLTGTNPLASMGNAIRLAGGLNDTARRMMASGAISGKYDIDLPRNVRDRIESQDYQNTLVNSAAQAGRMLKHMAEVGMRASDLGPRMAVYQKALREGVSEAEALDRARDLLDFSTHGDGGAARFLAQTIPFLNARWQGIARTGRGFAGDNRNAMMMRGAMVTAATLALWYENHTDPEYQQKEDWDKQYAWQIKVGDTWWRIPKFYELGALFGTVPEILADYFDKSGYAGGSTRELQNAGLALFGNVFKFNPIPVAIRPIAEAYFNTDTYTGRPIVNEREASLNINDQYSPATSPSIVQLTHAYNAVSPLKVAPDQVQHLLRGYLAGWGGYLSAATDALGESAGWLPSQAAWRTTDYPVVNRFVREEPQAGNRIMTDFYNLKKELTQVAHSIKSAEEQGEDARVKQLREEHPGWEYSKALDQEGLALAKERRELNLKLQNPGFSAEAKRKWLDEFYVKRDQQMWKFAPKIRKAEGLPPMEAP